MHTDKQLPRPRLTEDQVATLRERALAAFGSLSWKKVPERGSWEAEFEGETFQCPASSDPRLNKPHPEEMIPLTVCSECYGYHPPKSGACPTCGTEFPPPRAGA